MFADLHVYCKNQICASNNAAHTWLRKVAICVTISIDRIYFLFLFSTFMLESASNCCTHSFLFSPLLWNVWIKSRIRIVFFTTSGIFWFMHFHSLCIIHISECLKIFHSILIKYANLMYLFLFIRKSEAISIRPPAPPPLD